MKKLILLLSMLYSSNSSAVVWVEIDDASRILWQMEAGGMVYFRNMDEFDGAQGSCCYSYKLDTATAGGKSVWATILSKIAAHKRITLGFPNIGTAAIPVHLSYIGRHSHASNE